MADSQDPRPTPPATRGKPGVRLVLRVAQQAGLVALFVSVALLGSVSGVLFAYSDDLPEITALDDYKPSTITTLLARDGSSIGQFATERRVVVGYDDISPNLRNAIIATEDADFERHFGLNIIATGRAIAMDLLTGEKKGGSTITQQVSRDLFLRQYMRGGGVYARTGWEGLERKVKEWIVAMKLERRFTKREIFTFYANQVYLGHGAYGVEAASHLYFDKPAKELTVEEAAVIAGMLQSPERLSPLVDPRRTLTRRNFVLQRMADEGFLTDEEASAAREHPLVLQGQSATATSLAPYFIEEIRKALEQQYGAKALYEAGLRVQTTLDPALQEAANAAIDAGLRRVDKRRNGYRKPARNVVKEGHELARFATDRWNRPILAGDIVPAVVMAASRDGARVRIGTHDLDLPRAGYAWTRKTSAADLFTPGDLIDVRVGSTEGGKPGALTLEQAPAVEGALLAIDNRTGQIRAMVGGFSFARSKFNRATQARRQVGSLFKPIVYTASIDRGDTPITTFIDEPVSFDAGAGQPRYSPQNYDRKYEGAVTLRRALEQSRNVPAVKALAEVGPRNVVGYARKFGLTGNYPPYLSLALGAAESTLTEMTAAYAAFPNQGVRMTPYAVLSVSDREGNLLQENRPRPQEAVRADTAFVMTNLLRGVVQRGTAAAANALDWPLAGKTGTMDEYTDAWFVGFDPNITVGVWVGYDEKKPLGYGETGGATALPIWIDFMRAYIGKYGDRTSPPTFEAPGNIVYVTLDSGVTEAFINGTQPGAGVVPPVEPDTDVSLTAQ